MQRPAAGCSRAHDRAPERGTLQGMLVGTDWRMSGPGICAAPMACADGARHDGALEGGHDPPTHASGLYYALSHAGVSDERVFERLIEALAREPIELPYLLGVYGDRRALPFLQARLAQVRAEGNDECLVDDLCETTTMLGGTPERAAAFGRGTLSGRLEAWKNPEPEGRDGVPDAASPKRPGRNEPCWCASGRKYKRCHRGEDEARGGA